MESSMKSMNKALLSNAQTEDSPENSSWTFYIQDFLCHDKNNVNEEHSYFSSGYDQSPSLLSDAASSSAAKKGTKNHHHEAPGFSYDISKCKSSSFKKRKAKGAAAMDDDLEDTASSPVNSPKVSDMNQFFEMKQKQKATADILEEKRNTSCCHTGLAVAGGDSDITDLKKRGLCLVPLSTIGNYFN